ncbi:MAG TPA: NTP transferase domain-containing protein [Pseudolabrys sp.]|nr:NTP transferase domain-containing protein [Pseudolabrys sp.]
MDDHRTIADATAVVLTGGKSSRMGRPKALLPFDGEPLIVHIVRHLKRVFAETVVVAAPEQELPLLPVALVRDQVAYQGPVSGIYRGLKAATKEVCFVTSCDAPFLDLALISHLLSEISDCDVVVPFWQERFQPLHAVYRRSVAPLLHEQLERGELRPIFLYDKVRTRKVHEDEIRTLDPEGMSFLNMNSPADYDSALQLWRKKHSLSVSVELFGVARMLAKTPLVSLDLAQGATLAQVFSSLADKFPVLVGRVINSEGLITGYACNINGLNFVRAPDAKVNSGDKIFILSADAGG